MNNPKGTTITLHTVEFDIDEMPSLYCPGFRIYMDIDADISQATMDWVYSEMEEFRRQRNLDAYKGTKIKP